MRSFVVAGVCLLLASSAMAATQVDLVARGIGPVVDPGVDGTHLILDVIITTDTPGGMTAASFGFNSPEAVSYVAFQNLYGSWCPNYADQTAGLPPVNTAGWSVNLADGAVVLPGGDINAIDADVPNVELSTIFGAGNAVSGLFAWLEVDVTAAPAPYVIGIDGTVGNAQFQKIEGVVFNGLTVLPEPASAMLLLLGVPFLRRRR